MVISIQELRKAEQQRQLEQTPYSQKPGRFPWQAGQFNHFQSQEEKAPQGALKLARFLYGE